MLPQEVEVWYLIPAIRRELVIELSKLGLNQSIIAKKLNLTRAAVSQYLSKKRATKLSIDLKPLKRDIRRAAKNLLIGNCVTFELQKLVLESRRKGITCKIHKQLDHINGNCDICKKLMSAGL